MKYLGYTYKTWAWCVVVLFLDAVAIVNSNIIMGTIITGAVLAGIGFGENVTLESKNI